MTDFKGKAKIDMKKELIDVNVDVISLKDDMQNVKKLISNNQIELKQGIFYDGQIISGFRI